MSEVLDYCEKGKKAAKSSGMLNNEIKNNILLSLIERIESNKENIIIENKRDLENARNKGLNQAIVQRLEINDKVFNEMIDGIKTIINLDDPIGEIIESKIIQKTLKLRKVRVPLGVVLIIYESRPNVTIDVSAICIKSGNAVILKGGSEALHSNLALYNCIKQAFQDNNVDDGIVQLIEKPGHETVNELLQQDEFIDVVIPRGGKKLIRNVVENSKIPVIKHYEGICNIFIDKDANIEKAINIVINAKVQKAGTCNAVENLVVHKDIAQRFLPVVKEEFKKNDVEVRGCVETKKIIDAKEATEEDYKTEYLAKIISIKVVDDVDEAISFIDKYGSGHSDAIVTEDKMNANKFLDQVDSAAVYHNASTRFTDGGQFGMGCEIGISTQKLHARGPMGLKEMTSYKYLIEGDGEVRG
ncbi:MAG: glutamate-5-semialdehyde dehydrogenase [Candidatus Woesearchaeota archaeon]